MTAVISQGVDSTSYVQLGLQIPHTWLFDRIKSGLVYTLDMALEFHIVTYLMQNLAEYFAHRTCFQAQGPASLKHETVISPISRI